MLKIRLKKTGRSKQPSFRVVVIESSKPRDGRSVEEIGLYSPRNKENVFVVNKERAAYWLKAGAQPSETIAQFFVKEGLVEKLKRGSKKPSTVKKTEKVEE